MTSPIVQSNVGDGDGIVSVVPYTQPQTKGNCNVVFFAWDDTTALIAGTPTDTLGNTYQLLVQSTLNDLSLYVYVAYNIQAAAANANSVTAQTNVAPSFPELYIAEVPAAYVDSMTVAIASAATGVLASAGPVTPARNNETLLAYCYNDNTATGPGAGWTLDSNSISGYGAVLEYMTATLAGGPPVTATTPLGSPTKWVQVILGFYMPDENFQDIVVLSGDTLNHEGAMFNIGTSTASTVYAGFSNSAAQLVLAATQTVDATLWLPDVNGTLAVESQLGPAGLAAGTQTATSGTVVFSNSNGVTFGMNGSSVVTASVNAAGGGVALERGDADGDERHRRFLQLEQRLVRDVGLDARDGIGRDQRLRRDHVEQPVGPDVLEFERNQLRPERLRHHGLCSRRRRRHRRGGRYADGH